MLEAAVDITLEHSERPVVDDLAAGRFLDDATGLRHDDASGLEHGNAAATGRLELDDASSASVGQQRVEIIWSYRGPPVPSARRVADIGGIHIEELSR